MTPNPTMTYLFCHGGCRDSLPSPVLLGLWSNWQVFLTSFATDNIWHSNSLIWSNYWYLAVYCSLYLAGDMLRYLVTDSIWQLKFGAGYLIPDTNQRIRRMSMSLKHSNFCLHAKMKNTQANFCLGILSVAVGNIQWVQIKHCKKELRYTWTKAKISQNTCIWDWMQDILCSGLLENLIIQLYRPEL